MDINPPDAGTGAGPQAPYSALDAPLRERRREQRRAMTRVVPYSLGPENGGVITDICSAGMGLRADLPMDAADHNVSFSLMVEGSRLQGSAEIVWMDPARRSCGVRFTSVTPSLRLQVNQWIDDPQSDALPNDAEPVSAAEPAPAIVEAADAGAVDTSATETQATNHPARNSFLIDDWAKRDRDVSATRSRAFLGGLATGLLLAAVAVGVVFYLGLITPGRTLALARVSAVLAPPASAPSSAVPSASPGTTTAGVPSAPLAAPPDAASAAPASPAAPPALPADSLPRQQDPSAAAPDAPSGAPSPLAQEHASPAGPDVASGASALDEADADLRAGRNREAAALLWTAVSVGNTAAEMKLADLYLVGKGVVRSCTQGRVLLTAAAKKGNADAQQRLSSLLRTGCR